jgi:hypothetical protein
MAQTSSLAEWYDADDGLPDPDTIKPPAVLVAPASVVAHGLNPAVLVVNMAEGFMAFLGTDDALVTEDRFTLDCLACLVWQLPRLVMACSDPNDPDAELDFETEEGFTVRRLEPGILELHSSFDDSVRVQLPPAIAWQLVAELTALMVRRIAHTAGMVDQLETALEQSEPLTGSNRPEA